MNKNNSFHLIEKLAVNAWPAQVSVPLDGWQMRWHPMTSRRVNSVWPNAWGGEIPLAIKLEMVEVFYGLRGQPARYQICPAAMPVGLDEVLETRGYSVDAVTAVQVAEVVDVMGQSSPSLLSSEIKVFKRLEDEWLDGYCLVQGASPDQVPIRRIALRRVRQQSIYVMIEVNGRAAAVGRGVLEQAWLGVFGMSTQVDCQRKGLATAVIHTLAGWANEQGAESMYLQVMENNPGALALYAKTGFETLYHYHYREQQVSHS